MTHTHFDHFNLSGVKALIKSGVSFYCTEPVAKWLFNRYNALKPVEMRKKFKIIENGYFEVGSFVIKAFEVPHDSPGGCSGFSILGDEDSRIKKISIATDLGYSNDRILSNFHDNDMVIIESNHDVEMLENSTRPKELIDRIKQIGHLSNIQCSDFINTLIDNSKIFPEFIMLAHISQQCNKNIIAKENIEDVLKRKNMEHIRVVETYEKKSSEIITI